MLTGKGAARGAGDDNSNTNEKVSHEEEAGSEKEL